MTEREDHALAVQLERLVTDVPRLRRRLAADDYAVFTLDRIGGAAEWIALVLAPTAAELVHDGFDVNEALAAVDAYADELRNRFCPERGIT